MDKIVIENLSVQYSDGTESLKNINLSIREKCVTVLFGPGGGGMAGSMFASFFISMIGMTLLLVALIRSELVVEALKDRAADLKHKIGG